MDQQAPRQSDPIWWCFAIVAVFGLLAAVRLGIPSKTFFDEVHYIPAAQTLAQFSNPANAEHPLMGKTLFALSMELLGDNPIGWRAVSFLSGMLGLFAFMRMLWWGSDSRAVTLVGGLFLATSFTWIIHARHAMLDGPMAGFALLAGWAVVKGCAMPEQARRNFLLGGILMGLALGTKWTVAPLLVLPGLAFAWSKYVDTGARFLTASDGGIAPGVSMAQAAVYFALVPLATYWLTFAPGFFYASEPIAPLGFVEHHRTMLWLQTSVVEGHPYASVWWQWVLNARGIWYLYEVVDGAQRGVLLIGNPVTMYAGLAALALSLWRWIRTGEGQWALAPLAWGGLIAFWIVAEKPVQFYFHYMLPAIVLMGGLALVLGRWWDAGLRWPAYATVAAASAFFAYFYPVLTAGALEHNQDFLKWAWFAGWR